MKKSRLSILAALAAILLLAGCSAKSIDFSLDHLEPGQDLAKASIHSDDAVNKTIGVDAFIDFRPQKRGSDSKKWMGFIPGVLWLEIDSDMPELYTAFSPFNSEKMNLSAARAVYGYMKSSGHYGQVIYLPIDPYREVDYRLEGVLYRTLVEETGYYYGSSIYAWVTRILGLPYVSYRVTLDMELRLRSLKDNKVVWKERFSGTMEDKYNNVYSLASGREGKHHIAYLFSKILQDNMERLEPAMLEAIRNHAGNIQ